MAGKSSVFAETCGVYGFDSLRADLDRLRRAHKCLDVFAIGRSVLRQELYCAKWGEGDVKVLLAGAFHGMEWLTSALLMRFLKDVCEGYDADGALCGTEVSKLHQAATFYVIPMVNPDGVEVATHGLTRRIPSVYADRLVRYNGGSRAFATRWQANARGVDLNHNYDAGFEAGKQAERELGITGPNHTRYSGERPESEPETLAMVRFTRELSPHVVLAYHSQGEVIYWDYAGKATAHAHRIAKRFARLTGYSLEEADGMASYSGYKDWVIEELGVPAYTVEVGLGENPLPPQQLPEIYAKNLPLWMDFAEWGIQEVLPV